MLVSVTARIKNGHLTKHREQLSLTQREAADLAGVPLGVWGAIECMRFKEVKIHHLREVSNYLDIPLDELCPKEVRDLNINLKRTMYREATGRMLEAHAAQQRLCLPPADLSAEEMDSKEFIKKHLDAALPNLSKREIRVLRYRYGIDGEETKTYKQIGRELGITRERVRQVEFSALRKLREMPEVEDVDLRLELQD